MKFSNSRSCVCVCVHPPAFNWGRKSTRKNATLLTKYPNRMWTSSGNLCAFQMSLDIFYNMFRIKIGCDLSYYGKYMQTHAYIHRQIGIWYDYLCILRHFYASIEYVCVWKTLSTYTNNLMRFFFCYRRAWITQIQIYLLLFSNENH